MPLSEDEQRVLDEIERQLRIGDGRVRSAPRVKVVNEASDPVVPGVSTPVLVLSCVAGIVAVVVGVLIGGIFGVLVGWLGFVGLVFGGVGLVRGSQALIAEQVQLLADRYNTPPNR